MLRNRRKSIIGLCIAAILALALGGCGSFQSEAEKFEQAWKGVDATMTTYSQAGQKIDQVHGRSFRITRDDRFDGTNSDGSSKQDSSVLMISLGDSHISHVGSSMVLVQDGVVDVSSSLPKTVSLENYESGTPWLNDMRERFRNAWGGKAKTLMVRSQDGTPIAIFAGNKVVVSKTDVPKSTMFMVDGKYLFVYRCDYTMYDNEPLK